MNKTVLCGLRFLVPSSHEVETGETQPLFKKQNKDSQLALLDPSLKAVGTQQKHFLSFLWCQPQTAAWRMTFSPLWHREGNKEEKSSRCTALE